MYKLVLSAVLASITTVSTLVFQIISDQQTFDATLVKYLQFQTIVNHRNKQEVIKKIIEQAQKADCTPR